jgi:hypothetical protein
VQIPLAELGAAGVDALVEQNESGEARDVVLGAAPTIAVRGSTAPPRLKGHE